MLKVGKRVYNGRYAVGFQLSDGKLYTDAQVKEFLLRGGRIFGLRLRSGVLEGNDGIKLSNLSRLAVQTKVEVSQAQTKAVEIVRSADLHLYYRGLDAAVLQQVYNAHVEVLRYGLEKGGGCEKVVVVDIMTGRTKGIEGTKRKYVPWELDASWKGNVIVVHNHPDSLPFSTRDLDTFGSDKRIFSLAAHGHDGTIFYLQRGHDLPYTHTLKSLRRLLARVRKDRAYEELSGAEKIEVFVAIVIEAHGWYLMKQNKYN
jgi:hypothetical protein